MEAGSSLVPEDAEGPRAPLTPEADAFHRQRTGAGGLSFLATASAEELIARCPGVVALLPRIRAALMAQSENGAGLLFDLGAFNADDLKLIGEVMGEGEVAGTVALPDGVVAQIGESVFAGLWRVRFMAASGELLADYAEVSAVPQAVRRAAAMTLPEVAFGALPEGAMNVGPVLVEISDRARRHMAGAPNHVISLSLLPMSEVDIAFLMQSLGTGPVRLFTRGYGRCLIQASAVHNVWSVQFFNAADTMLLDTIEIGDVPEVARAAVEDFRESAGRLGEIEEAYFQ